METFDYDMAIVAFGQVPVAGQRAARISGARRPPSREGQPQPIGIKSTVIDELIEGLIRAPGPRQPGRAYSGARLGIAIRLLRDPALSFAAFRVAALGQIQPPADLAEIRHRTRHVVDRPGPSRPSRQKRAK